MLDFRQKTLAAAFVLSAGISPLASAGLMEYAGVGADNISSAALFSSSIIVSDDAEISDVSITLNDFSHTWIGDFYATLVFDDGANPLVTVDLFGLNDGNLGPNNDANGTYTFADGGTGGFTTAGNPIPSGTYAAIDSFSVFDGVSSSGTWTLNLDDQFGGDSGALRSWTLSIDGDASNVPAPATLALLGLGLAGVGLSRRKRA